MRNWLIRMRLGFAVLLFGAGQGWAKEEKGTDLWSFQPLRVVEALDDAEIRKDWGRSPIDRWIYQSLADQGLEPGPRADRRTLIRRATYDLLGLPPTPEEVDAFEMDASADAYERLIDRLLASPHYGEQWGRHWLDVIRFGESRGFERNEIIRNAWPFRDYVIRSFNEDKPFDQFIVEQLAGDQVGPGDPRIEVGSAFLVAGPYDDVGNQDAKQARLIRANTVDDIINAVSGAFLGLTVSCARCHDHKFDPISAEDYYRFYAVFAGVHHGERVLATVEEREQREEQLKPLLEARAGAEEALRAFEAGVMAKAKPVVEDEAAYALPKVHPHLTEDRFGPVEARYLRLNIKSNDRNPRQGGNVRIDELEVWSAEDRDRNVALAERGGTVEASTRRAEDFAEAYSAGFVIDGRYGARWISPGAGALTITFPRVERIERVTFSADRPAALPAGSGEIVFVGEYDVEVSMDGEEWRRVADSLERPPIDQAFARARAFEAALSEADRVRWHERQREVGRARAAVDRVPPLRTVWAGRFQPIQEPTYVFEGGDPERKGALVQPASLSRLDAVVPGFALQGGAPEGERRLALAQWLVQKDHPLTWRVLANRVWQYHFGAGLVRTPSDFGKLGGEPSHPELLDWLAVRLQEHGWRLKPLHREIMLSETYRQSSTWRAEAGKMDADARWLWRFPPRRLAAEEIRDSMLQAGGALKKDPGGPGFKLYRYLQDNVATYLPLDKHGPETYRRGVYHHNARAAVVDLMSDFDLPDCSFAAPRRAVTTSPLQALTLFNHSFTIDMGRAVAEGVRGSDVEGGIGGEVSAMFERVFQRAPDPLELEAARELVQGHGLAALGRALMNANEFIYLE